MTEEDIHLFTEGTHRRLYEVLGSHATETPGDVRFALWAPSADSVSVICEANGWRPDANPLSRRQDGSGIWEGVVSGVDAGTLYKYRLCAQSGAFVADRGDPFARSTEGRPGAASRVWRQQYRWTDSAWLQSRAQRQGADRPLSIYELHLESWRKQRYAAGSGECGFETVAGDLADYVAGLGFTHVKLLRALESPDPDGARISGFFAPAAAQASPEDLMLLVDQLHRREIGVILDWTPFAALSEGDNLACFDGTPLFEAAAPLEDGAGVLDVERPQVRSFLLSSALFWTEVFHIDGLHLSLDGLPATPSAAELLRVLEAAIREVHPDTVQGQGAPVLCIVDQDANAASPQSLELACSLTWNEAWSSMLLAYLERAPYERMHQDVELWDPTRAETGARWILPLSHAQGSLLERMPEDDWRQRASLRLLLGWLYACPGKKLLFMGGELGQREAWDPQAGLQWTLLQIAGHLGLQTWVRDLNQTYRQTPALFERDFSPAGAERIRLAERADSVLAFLRRGSASDDQVLVVCNAIPQPIRDCRVGVPKAGCWEEILNSDAWMYGGSQHGNLGAIESDPVPVGDYFSSLLMTLPPLGIVFLRYTGAGQCGRMP